MQHPLTLQPTYARLIASGQKTIEARLASRNTRAMHVGDILAFNGEALMCCIECVAIYPSFAAMIAAETPRALGFSSAEEALRAYRSIYWYTKDRPHEVMAFAITPLPRTQTSR